MRVEIGMMYWRHLLEHQHRSQEGDVTNRRITTRHSAEKCLLDSLSHDQVYIIPNYTAILTHHRVATKKTKHVSKDWENWGKPLMGTGGSIN